MLLTVIPALRSDLRTHEAENQENFSTGGLESWQSGDGRARVGLGFVIGVSEDLGAACRI